MKKQCTMILVLCLAVATCAPAWAKWYEGTVLIEGQTIFSGKIAYDSQRDFVQLQQANRVHVFTAYQAIAFQFYDPEMNLIRRFESKKVAGQQQYAYQQFFEIVLDGDIKVLRRPSNFTMTPKNEATRNRYDMLREQLQGYDYFTYIKGDLLKIKKFRKELLPLLVREHQNEMESFLKENRIDTNLISHNIMVINYFNQLEGVSSRK
jgi:hypothetical protein